MVTTSTQSEAAPAVPILDGPEVLNRLRESAAKHLTARPPTPRAFFSSVLGGIVTDPGLMVVPMDDHMVHRGHSVFDTCQVFNFRAYQLDPHLDRLLKSATLAGISPTFTREQLRNFILATAAAAGQKQSFVRYWLSVGRGGFGVSPSETKGVGGGSQFYVVVHDLPENPLEKYAKGIKVVTTTIPIKPGFFACIKSTNYLPNAMMAGEAESAGASQGMWVDEKGNIAESATANVAFVIEEGVLTVPKFDQTLAGVTVRRVLEVAVREGVVKRVEQRDVSVAEAKRAKEAMLIGSSTNGLAIVQWDDQPIADGKPGPVANAIRAALWKDRVEAEDQLVDIPGLTPA